MLPPLSAAQFEAATKLTLIHAEDEDGITAESLSHAQAWLGHLDRPRFVYLVYAPDPWAFWTYVVDHRRGALRFSGFAWGYGGEGPRGLFTLLALLGWRTPGLLPEAHIPGIWSLDKKGRCKSLAVEVS
jgi:hypothetical protein